ncbi:mRNA splicing protein [Blyttiomyces sp. JEL0837]|nr:mRNA splicing protein [Blyttiomyces sp. JEL0837]
MSSSAAAEAAAGQQKLSREDFKRQKAIEEQRKAGTLPAEVDPETGRDINPHIPHYISAAPWYLDINHATLKHQRAPETKQLGGINDWYERGKTLGVAKKYRKGACENCGAMTHETKDCMDRPRKTGAKFTNKNIAPDEYVGNVELGFEAKRDRWNGYDPNDHAKIVEEWELIDQERKRIREQQTLEKLSKVAEDGKKEAEAEKKEAEGDDDESDNEDDEDKYAEGAEAVGQKHDHKTRTTVRNLRIREDTAKYLLNLDVNSAYYDPKTRSMRDNPRKDKDPSDLAYAGDNFVRWTGDAPKMAELQSFAWEAEEKNRDVNLQSNPTMGELLFKEYQKKKEKVSETQRDTILERYGGAEHLQAPPKELLLAQTEQYVEYSQTGKIIRGQEKASIKSKYEEDVYPLNHKSVWGSYWNAGKWGYACCHSNIRSAYCTGEAGKEAARSSSKLMQQSAEASGSSASASSKTLLEAHILKAAKDGSTAKVDMGKGKARLGEGDIVLDKDKLKKALEAEEKRKKESIRMEEEEDFRGGKKRKYNSTEVNTEVTEEELEAYRMKRANFEDPMANYKDDDEDS